AHRYRHAHTAEPQAGAAAVHGRVAAADHHHAPADSIDVLEGHRGEPVDANMDVGGALPATGNVEVLPLGRTGADEDGVELFRQQRREAPDLVSEAGLDAEAQDALHL